MKLKLLPSSFAPDGSASPRQHLTCFLINNSVAIDAGSLAMAVSDEERSNIRDIVITHAHLDHIAGLPLFIDDQFSEIEDPIRIHATREVIEILERDVFNWSVYPRFSELKNAVGPVMEYKEFRQGEPFTVGPVEIYPIEVNHKVPCSGFVISDDSATIAITGDTADMDDFWTAVSRFKLSALLIECAFPDNLQELAEMSRHLTPSSLFRELEKFEQNDCEILAINIKPAYRESVINGIKRNKEQNVEILEVGRTYSW